MKRLCIITIIIFLNVLPAFPGDTQENNVFLREEFNDLKDWKPLYFRKIKSHTDYSVVKEGKESYLKAESNASASGIVFDVQFSVFEYPNVKWRWKVNNVFKKGNAKKRSGDDYPLRVYIVFKYNPEKASIGQRLKYRIAKNIYGEYPPQSTLNYIWTNRKHAERIITNTYSDKAKMIVLQSGEEHTGEWVEQEINIIKDYHAAFGEDPPAIASVAVMSDSDNTGESAVAYIDYIEVFR